MENDETIEDIENEHIKEYTVMSPCISFILALQINKSITHKRWLFNHKTDILNFVTVEFMWLHITQTAY